MNHYTRSSSAIRHRGFTLVEMLASLTILSIIMLSAGAVMTLAARAFNNSTNTNSPAVQTAAARSAVDQISDDMKMAKSFPTTSPTSVTFTVPDRTGDGTDETITYSWAGAGSPLMRTFNGGTPTTMASNVQNFNLNYITKTLGPPPSPPIGTSAEELLFSSPSPVEIKDFSMTNSNWCASYFQPTLPSNTITWAITRIKLQMRANPPPPVPPGQTQTGTVNVQVRIANSSFQPTTTVLGTGTINVASLVTTPGGGWINVPFSNLSGLSPTASLAVVATWTPSGPSVVNLEYDDKTRSSATMSWSQTTNAGTSWTTNTNNVMQIYVYGTVTAPNP